MTICLAYVRNTVCPPELILASDSQLNCGGGEKMFNCQKIFPLKRGDVAIGFTGETDLFFPILQQIVNFCDEHKKNYSRSTSINVLASHILKIANSMLSHIKPGNVKGCKEPIPKTCEIFLIGWDCRASSTIPLIKKYFVYSEKSKEFERKKINVYSHKGKKIAHNIYIIGDCVDDFAKEYNKEALSFCLKENKLNEEPLKIFQKILNKNHPQLASIGGTVQAVKVYQYLRTLPYCVERQGHKYLYGRELEAWENVEMESTHIKLS